MPTFSIITIVYNGISHILETIESITSQSYGHFEYILIDGASTDGTKEAILHYFHSHTHITHQHQTQTSLYLEATHLARPTISFKFLSQKDHGIYDAMNKGILLASKEWINFMNCGDRFIEADVLEKISQKEIQSYDVLYGDTKVYFTDQKIYLDRKAHEDLKSLWRLFSGFNHQAFFFKTSLHKQHLYSTNYKLVSDYDLVYYLFAHHFRFKYLKMPISIFGTGGSSDLCGFLTLHESLQVALNYNRFPHNLKVYAYYLFGMLKKSIKLYAPASFVKAILLLLTKKQKHSLSDSKENNAS